MARTLGTRLSEKEERAIVAIGDQKKWSTSQVIAECVRESPLFREALNKNGNAPARPDGGRNDVDEADLQEP